MNIRYTIATEAPRLDRFLVEVNPQIARSKWEMWIKEGKVFINGKPATKAGMRLKPGWVVETEWPDIIQPGMQLEPESIDLPTILEDDRLWVLNKPAGIVVHPGPGHSSGTVLNALLWRLHNSVKCIEWEKSSEMENEDEDLTSTIWPGLVHRLDRFTTGCLVTTKDELAQRNLQEQFKARTVEKRYLAFVRKCKRLSGNGPFLIDKPIGRHRIDRLRMTVSSIGRPSQTRVHVLGEAAGLALVECELLTGRTHQIRVHLSYLGAPLLGDPLYGGPIRWQDQEKRPIFCEHPMLHARKMAFDHPSDKRRITVEAPLPANFLSLLEQLKINVLGSLFASYRE